MRLKQAVVALAAKILASGQALRQIWTKGGFVPVRLCAVEATNRLEGKRVLVTGGSAGIGYAIAKKCAEEGAVVAITGRSPDRLAAAVTSASPDQLHSLVWDVADLSLVSSRLDEVTTLLGGEPDILVNNAGILGGHHSVLELDEARWEQVMSTNLKGLTFLTAELCRRWLRREHKAKILNISSMRGQLGVKDGPYGMSKWALDGFTRGLGLEMAPRGIIVNGIAPGVVATESITVKNVDVESNAFFRSAPLGRLCAPFEVAELAVFMLSDAADYMVGQTIVFDGGYSLKS